MKKLSIEEKAKAYDEALERAKAMIKVAANQDEAIGFANTIFPELKESEDEKIRKELITHCRNTTCVTVEGAERIVKWITWLEKQNKQKPVNDTDEDIVEAVKDTSILDMVEPKFKVGDWVVNDNFVYHIDKISGVYLTLSTLDGTALVYHISVLDNDKIHLWTIEDAKYGDVLVDVYENIGIYQQHDDFDWTSYCSLGFHGGFQNFKVEHENDKTHPATKKQRDTLMKAMADAGWEFDFEKKELKKIEQKPAWSDEDERAIGIIKIALEHPYDMEGKWDRKFTLDWLKSLQDRIGG